VTNFIERAWLEFAELYILGKVSPRQLSVMRNVWFAAFSVGARHVCAIHADASSDAVFECELYKLRLEMERELANELERSDAGGES
jgi:hypothetical protein